jgi:hypothetical protein
MQLSTMAFGENDLQLHKQLQSGLQLHMQIILATNVYLNENKKYNHIIHF